MLELEQEKYEFLRNNTRDTTKFLKDCFHSIDTERKGFIIDK